jgi:hypothetical protein
MGEAKRRREANGNKRVDIKIPPRKRQAGFFVAHHRRVEEQYEDGMVYAINFFTVIDANGYLMIEETPDGPKPVVIQSNPQPVRRAVIATPTLARVGT